MVFSFALLASECIREHIMDTMLFECKLKIKLLSTVTNCVDSFSIAGTSLQCLQKKCVARLLKNKSWSPALVRRCRSLWIWSSLLRWGCREHFVSGCWHSSGRDRGRYPRECWLSTLGVLHPGVLVMWYGHIRDLSPTAEGCMGGRLPNVTLLHWAQQE